MKPLHQSQNSQQQQQQATSRNTVKQHINGSDSGQGSEADDGGIRLAYHFYIPHYLCGQFIGMGGAKIKQLKTNTKCSVQLRQLDENGHFKTIQQQRESRSGLQNTLFHFFHWYRRIKDHSVIGVLERIAKIWTKGEKWRVCCSASSHSVNKLPNDRVLWRHCFL